jgi:hypothetical protein
MEESLGDSSLEIIVELENITVHAAKWVTVQQSTNTEHKE